MPLFSGTLKELKPGRFALALITHEVEEGQYIPPADLIGVYTGKIESLADSLMAQGIINYYQNITGDEANMILLYSSRQK